MGYYFKAYFMSKTEPIGVGKELLEWEQTLKGYWYSEDDIKASLYDKSKDQLLRDWLETNKHIATVWIGENNEIDLYNEPTGITNYITISVNFEPIDD